MNTTETVSPALTTIRKLIFVYETNSGKLNGMLESAKKLLSLNGCSLCAITHGLVGEKGEWKVCSEQFGVPIDYLHKDEISLALSSVINGQLPCVLAQTDSQTRVLLAPDVLDRAKGSVADLKGRLRTYAAINNLQFP